MKKKLTYKELEQRVKKLEKQAVARQQAEKALRESEEKYRVLAQQSQLGVSMMGRDGHYKYVNPKFVEMFGYTLEDIPTGREWFKKAYPNPEYRTEAISTWLADLKRSKKGHVRPRTFTVTCKDGSEKVVQFRPVTLETGDQSVIYDDITESKQAEETLHIYEQIISTVSDLMSLLDKDYRYLAVNDAYLKAFPANSREDIVGRTPADLIGKKNFRKQIKPNLDRCLSGEIVNYQDKFVFPGKGEVYNDITYYPIFARDGSVSAVAHISRDITERKRAEQALQRITDEQAVLLSTVPAMIFWIDKEANIIRVNDSFAAALHKSSDDIEGKSLFDLYPEDMARHYHNDNLEVIESGTAKTHIVEPIETPAGTMWVRTDKIPHRNEKGEIEGIIGFSEDVTERKQAEEALKEKGAVLKATTSELEEVNAALRVLLKQQEMDRRELEEKVMLNVKELVIPYAEKLRKNLTDAKQTAYLNILESNLNDIISPFAHKLSSKYSRLTPTEIQTAQLIKQGRTTKEISELLNVSARTIESHRQNIRVKMGLHTKKANLRSYLLSM
jgi:PAS domain S-box-containing protein